MSGLRQAIQEHVSQCGALFEVLDGMEQEAQPGISEAPLLHETETKRTGRLGCYRGRTSADAWCRVGYAESERTLRASSGQIVRPGI